MECNRLFADDPDETTSQPIPLEIESPFYNVFGNAMNQYYNNISSQSPSRLSSSSGSSYLNDSNSCDIPSPRVFSSAYDYVDPSYPLNAEVPIKKSRSLENIPINEPTAVVVNGNNSNRDEKSGGLEFGGWLNQFRA